MNTAAGAGTAQQQPPPPPPAPGWASYQNQPQQTKTNGFAVASLVLGILWIWWIGSILAIVFGFIAKRQIEESRGTQTGKGLAIAGIILGGLGLLSILSIVAITMLGSSAEDKFTDVGTELGFALSLAMA